MPPAALQRAALLKRAVDHYDRHPDVGSCPVCGTTGKLDAAWATDALVEIAALRQEAETATAARAELRSAVRAVQDLVHTPERIPVSLTDPWDAWTACRTVGDPAELARRALEAAVVLADACAAVRERAAGELEKRDERWCALVARPVGWAEACPGVEAAKGRLRDLRKASAWLKALAEKLRQESNIHLKAVSLKGSEKATVRKLVMDVTVDGREASALGVMSQGEQHSLALSLFLPRAATTDSPFGFIVIDDPVPSMDPAKVHGLARVLHELGEHRQVVVFTHDTRLQRAFADQELPVTGPVLVWLPLPHRCCE